MHAESTTPHTLTRLGRLRARSGSKLPTANVPLRALEVWGAKDEFISGGAFDSLWGTEIWLTQNSIF